MAFRWRADGGPTLNPGLVALWFYRGSGPVLLRNPIFCDFSWGGGSGPLPPPPPHLDLRMYDMGTQKNHLFEMVLLSTKII